MKTTEQAAREYSCIDVLDKCEKFNFKIDEELLAELETLAFKMGVAFAEEFISFQDEVPPISKEKILLKREKPNSETIYELRRFTTKNKTHILAIYTHWRPINRK